MALTLSIRFNSSWLSALEIFISFFSEFAKNESNALIRLRLFYWAYIEDKCYMGPNPDLDFRM